MSSPDLSRVHEISEDPSLSDDQKVERLKDLLNDVWSLQRAEAGGQSGEIVWDDYLREVKNAIEKLQAA